MLEKAGAAWEELRREICESLNSPFDRTQSRERVVRFAK